jgi:hypothetical protein
MADEDVVGVVDLAVVVAVPPFGLLLHAAASNAMAQIAATGAPLRITCMNTY